MTGPTPAVETAAAPSLPGYWALPDGRARLYCGDCRDVLPTLPAESVDAVVCDPPYELGFMGRAWDRTGVAFDPRVWAECLRILKPGGHVLAFGGTRTVHRLTCAIEDSGAEIRDMLLWLYGTGFPKSLDVGKAIDERLGAERPVIRTERNRGVTTAADGKRAVGDYAGQWDVTAPATPEAAAWDGWGTALKPACEPVVMARKPLAGSVAANVLAHGVGGLNVRGCRVPVPGADPNDPGRWPANVVHDGSDEVEAEFARLGEYESPETAGQYERKQTAADHFKMSRAATVVYGDAGTRSRFYYCAKADATDRDDGLDGWTPGPCGVLNMLADAHAERTGNTTAPRKNLHPTVKPTALMRWLVRLVCPAGGVVLDPFAGSGSTGRGATMEGARFVGVELSADNCAIAAARIRAAAAQGVFGF